MSKIYLPEMFNEIDEKYISSCYSSAKKRTSHGMSTAVATLVILVMLSLLALPFYVVDNPPQTPAKTSETSTVSDFTELIPKPDDYIVEEGVMLGYTGNDETIMIPYEVRAISAEAFAEADSVRVVYLTPNVESVADTALIGCKNLEEVIVGENTHVFDCGGLILDKTKTKILYWNKKSIGKTVAVPEGVKELPSRFLQGNDNVRELILPESLKTVGENALKFCAELEKIDFGGCEVISAGAFSNSGIKEVRLGNSVKRIEAEAFLKSRLKKVFIPKSVEYIDQSAFKYCNLSEIEYEGAQYRFVILAEAFIGMKNVTYIYGEETPENNKLVYYSNGDGTCHVGPSSERSEAGVIIIPEKSPDGDTVTGIRSFEGCDITHLIMPDTVIYLEEKVFKDCKKLENVKLSKSLTYLPNYAFTGCDALKNQVITSSIQALGAYSFSNNLVYRNNLYLFMYFDYYNELSYTLDHTFAGSLTMTGFTVGAGHKRLRHYVDREATVENAVELRGTFENCINMTWVSIGERVTSIDGDTFKGCISLEKIYYSGTLEEWQELSKKWIDIPELDGVEITVKANEMPWGEKIYVRGENGDYVQVKSHVTNP